MKRLFLLTLVLLVGGCTQKPDDTPIQEQQGWTSGTLSNGLRYHIYPNNKEAVALRMYVHVGSANETAQQKATLTFLNTWRLMALVTLAPMIWSTYLSIQA